MKLVSLILLFFAFMLGTTAEQCGTQAGGAVCPNGQCCSQFGWCGNTNDYCGNGCQSQCSSTTPSPTTPSSGSDVSSLISTSLFDQMLKHRNDQGSAAQSFNGFGTTGDVTPRKRELAAFLAQTSHETTRGWASAPDGPYAWGYCFITENDKQTYCTPIDWPCASGK
ncbi:endochitinase [Quercus suber]|uniref:chitinase n=1 Tax=Quercus suber TaxID=58331 RepID=A0AAW0JF91_QUESU